MGGLEPVLPIEARAAGVVHLDALVPDQLVDVDHRDEDRRLDVHGRALPLEDALDRRTFGVIPRAFQGAIDGSFEYKAQQAKIGADLWNSRGLDPAHGMQPLGFVMIEIAKGAWARKLRDRFRLGRPIT